MYERPGLSGLGDLSAEARAWYTANLNVAFAPRESTAVPRVADIPGWGNVVEDDVPHFYLTHYGSERPAPGTPAGAMGALLLNGVWSWWYGDPPPVGSPAYASFVALPFTVPNGRTPPEVFPSLLGATAPSMTVTPTSSATPAPAFVAPTFAVGDRKIENGLIQEWTGTTWKVIGPAPSASVAVTPSAPIAIPVTGTSQVPPPITQPIVGGINQLQPAPSSPSPMGGESYSGGGGGGGGGGGMVPGGGEVGTLPTEAGFGGGIGLGPFLLMGAVVGILIASAKARRS